MPLTIVWNDITKMQTDAIVNAANNDLQNGTGVCGAIFAAAGVKKLKKRVVNSVIAKLAMLLLPMDFPCRQNI